MTIWVVSPCTPVVSVGKFVLVSASNSDPELICSVGGSVMDIIKGSNWSSRSSSIVLWFQRKKGLVSRKVTSAEIYHFLVVGL